MSEVVPVKHYFVDEAGDLTLFDKSGRIIVGQDSSHCFMVGLADLPDPEAAAAKLEELRRSLLADPYFRNVPSMQPERKKTAICFHAKDDLPEVRREVFKLLPTFEPRIIVAIRRKSVLAMSARERFMRHAVKFKPNEVYDDLISRVFRDKLHTAEENRITFARRGKAVRQEALEDALIRARRNFEARWRRQAEARPTLISSAYPSESAGLQVVDYYLWALQRMYEKGEERFFQAVAGQYRLIMDLDDTRQKPYGEWYSDAKPCELQKIVPVAS